MARSGDERHELIPLQSHMNCSGAGLIRREDQPAFALLFTLRRIALDLVNDRVHLPLSVIRSPPRGHANVTLFSSWQ